MSGFRDHGHYFHEKERKLQKQAKKLVCPPPLVDSRKDYVFSGFVFYFDGVVLDSCLELKQCILVLGGKVVQYYRGKDVTHVVCSSEWIPPTKVNQYKKKFVVNGDFVLDCFKENRKLREDKYVLACMKEKNGRFLDFRDSEKESHKCVSINPDKGEANSNIPNTKSDPDFINHYLDRSRLHLLGSWKREMYKKYRNQLKEGKRLLKVLKQTGKQRFIVHLDMDCFFASVGIRKYPHLKTKPVAVSHSKNGYGDISACNYVARKFGVRSSMFVKRAKELCPSLIVIPYQFDEYRTVSVQMYDILFKHCKIVQILSIDEVYMDISDICDTPESCVDFVQKLRREIFSMTQCTCSAGIGESIFLARIATSKAKPDGHLYLPRETAIHYLATEPVSVLPGIGRMMKKKLNHSYDIHTVEHLARHTIESIQGMIGQAMGKQIYDFCRGIDHRDIEIEMYQKSLGFDINYGIRFENNEDQNQFCRKLAKKLSAELKEYNYVGLQLTLKLKIRSPDAPIEAKKFMGHGMVDSYTKSHQFPDYTNEEEIIFQKMKTLLSSFNYSPETIRGIGITMSQLRWNDKNMNQLISKMWAKKKRQGPEGNNFTKRKKPRFGEIRSFDEIDKKVFQSLPIELQKDLRSQFPIPKQPVVGKPKPVVDKNQPTIETCVRIQNGLSHINDPLAKRYAQKQLFHDSINKSKHVFNKKPVEEEEILEFDTSESPAVIASALERFWSENPAQDEIIEVKKVIHMFLHELAKKRRFDRIKTIMQIVERTSPEPFSLSLCNHVNSQICIHAHSA